MGGGDFTRIYIGELIPRVYIIYRCAGDASSLGGRVLTWGRRVPASALPSWGSMPQLGNKKMYCICLSRHRALSSKCRRGDASPPGEDASPTGKGTLSTGEDALPAHLYIYYLEILIVLSALHATLIVHLNKEESTRSYLI